MEDEEGVVFIILLWILYLNKIFFVRIKNNLFRTRSYSRPPTLRPAPPEEKCEGFLIRKSISRSRDLSEGMVTSLLQTLYEDNDRLRLVTWRGERAGSRLVQRYQVDISRQGIVHFRRKPSDWLKFSRINQNEVFIFSSI